MWCGVVTVLAYVNLRTLRKRRRLARRGSLIDGEIVHCSSYEDSDNDLHLKAAIRFRSPQTGKWILKSYRYATI
jgi:hypothetical protein